MLLGLARLTARQIEILNYEDGDRGVPGVLQPPDVHLEAAAVVVDGMASAKDHIDQRALRVVGLDAVVPTLFG